LTDDDIIELQSINLFIPVAAIHEGIELVAKIETGDPERT